MFDSVRGTQWVLQGERIKLIEGSRGCYDEAFSPTNPLA
jgi:hypothetical protein